MLHGKHSPKKETKARLASEFARKRFKWRKPKEPESKTQKKEGIFKQGEDKVVKKLKRPRMCP